MSQHRTVTGEYWLTIYTPVFPFTFRFGTRTQLRDGQWFEGSIVNVVEPADDFDRARIAAGDRITVRIGIDLSDSVQLLATLLTNNFGFDALLEVETLVQQASGTTFTASTSKRYRYVSDSVNPKEVALTMSSIDDAGLDEVYPSARYTVAEYPNIDPQAADQPIPFPVGTALKVPCRLLAAQTLWDGIIRAPEWVYGVCELEWQSYAIVAVNTVSRQFSIAGDRTAQINVGDSIWVFDPASRTNVTNEGKYTVSARTFTSPNTVITVNESVGSATVTSNVNIPPDVLNVYRNGRLVNPTEYTVEVLDNGAGPVPATIGDFSTGATDWATSIGGTGTATLAGGTANITGDGGNTNWARFNLQAGRGGGLQQRRGMYAPWRITITGTGAAWLAANAGSVPTAGHGTLVRAGSPVRVLIKNAFAAADLRCAGITLNAGATGTNLTFDNWSIEQPAKPLLMIRFTREQRDPGGGLYTIEADVFGYRSRNVVDEIDRLLKQRGYDIEASSYSSAQAYATTHRMLIDCDHGARGARKVRAILEDLLFIARGGLSKNALGQYLLTQDREPTLANTGPAQNEDAGDLVDVESLSRANLVRAVEIHYRPSSRDPRQLLHTLRRDVFPSNGIGVDVRDCPYLRDHEAADRLACYLQVRALAPRRMRARLYLNRFGLGWGLSISSRKIYNGLTTFAGIIRQMRHQRLGIAMELMEQTTVDTYTAGTLPADIAEPYQPDYSQTPPAAPTALRITAAIGGTGRVSVEARPPVENWAELWFVVTHNTNNQIMGLVLGTFSATTGLATATIGGLTTGQVYRLEAYAKNAFLLQGTIQGTFDNTANGGGPAVTTFTA